MFPSRFSGAGFRPDSDNQSDNQVVGENLQNDSGINLEALEGSLVLSIRSDCSASSEEEETEKASRTKLEKEKATRAELAGHVLNRRLSFEFGNFRDGNTYSFSEPPLGTSTPKLGASPPDASDIENQDIQISPQKKPKLQSKQHQQHPVNKVNHLGNGDMRKSTNTHGAATFRPPVPPRRGRTPTAAAVELSPVDLERELQGATAPLKNCLREIASMESQDELPGIRLRHIYGVLEWGTGIQRHVPSKPADQKAELTRFLEETGSESGTHLGAPRFWMLDTPKASERIKVIAPVCSVFFSLDSKEDNFLGIWHSRFRPPAMTRSASADALAHLYDYVGNRMAGAPMVFQPYPVLLEVSMESCEGSHLAQWAVLMFRSSLVRLFIEAQTNAYAALFLRLHGDLVKDNKKINKEQHQAAQSLLSSGMQELDALGVFGADSDRSFRRKIASSYYSSVCDAAKALLGSAESFVPSPSTIDTQVWSIARKFLGTAARQYKTVFKESINRSVAPFVPPQELSDVTRVFELEATKAETELAQYFSIM